MLDLSAERVRAACAAYPLTPTSIARFGSGHINDTFKVDTDADSAVILQRINSDIFTVPDALMANIVAVCEHLRAAVSDQPDADRRALQLLPTNAGNPYLVDEAGEFWRMYQFIDGARTYDLVEKPHHFEQAGVAFGAFQRHLADFPAEGLTETIPHFHDTPARLQALQDAVEADTCDRADAVAAEIDFYLDRADFTETFTGIDREFLPVRVTHNDTKLNNVMIDAATGDGICVIDLDTVMPGLAVNDFGDSIRFGASTALEDERDLSAVHCSMELFEVFTRGFLSQTGPSLTNTEKELLPAGAKMMTLECGMRFLTDYLDGDKYFKIHHPEHNLDRTRTQMTLVASMEKQWETMHRIVSHYS